MTTITIKDLDIFYLSYDEPNKEEHYVDLLKKYPHAKRIDGVKGFDNAHKACARESKSDRFITIDGDNIVDEKFFDLVLNFPTNVDLSKSVISWGAKNLTNGLVYGNGGIKCWPVQLVLDMKTHENADNETKKLDFCWDLDYKQMNNTYSMIFNSGSPFQAFRSGFREGVKMSLDEGKIIEPSKFKTKVWPKNYHRLLTWCNVGADIENGLWAIYGARLGCYRVNFDETFITESISDYDWFKSYFNDEVYPKFLSDNSEVDTDLLYDASLDVGDKLVEMLGMELCDPTVEMSNFFKLVYINPKRVPNPLATEKSTGWDR